MFSPRVRYGLTALSCVLAAAFAFVATATRYNPSFEGRRMEDLTAELSREIGRRVQVNLRDHRGQLVLELRYEPRDGVFLDDTGCLLEMKELMELAAIRYTGFADQVRVNAEAGQSVPVITGIPAVRSRSQSVAELRRRFDRKQILESGDRLWPKLPGVEYRNWTSVVIHHSASPSGSAASFARYHKKVRRWDGGLGYHFVIGNGNGSRDGQIEAGERWSKQTAGAHAGVKKYNEHGIGVCLVGNFATESELASLKKPATRKVGERVRPTQKQQESLRFLVLYLALKLKLTPERILGHRDVKHTLCPGGNFPMKRFRRDLLHDLTRLKQVEE